MFKMSDDRQSLSISSSYGGESGGYSNHSVLEILESMKTELKNSIYSIPTLLACLKTLMTTDVNFQNLFIASLTDLLLMTQK